MSFYNVARKGKKIISKGRNILYHYRHKQQAYELIKNMNNYACNKASASIFKQCDEYAHDILGSIKYSPWLKAYSVFNGVFKEGWIPDNYYGEVIVPQLKGGYGSFSNYKPMSRRILETNLLPDKAYSVNGLLYTTSMKLLKPVELKHYLFKECSKIVYKKDNGSQGKSVFVYDKGSFPDNSYVFDNGVFQSYIAQHPFFNSFDSHSVSTIRITTVVDDMLNVSCRAAYLRLPRSEDLIVKSENAIKVAIKIENGELHEKGYLPNWTPVLHHPDSKKEFIYQKIPNFPVCVDTCVALHKKNMFPRVIGWDVIIDEQGNIVVMEWNGNHNGIKFSEAVNGPCFADLGWEHLWKTGV